jgi:uncharacterized LabA/DUF88 family protein
VETKTPGRSRRGRRGGVGRKRPAAKTATDGVQPAVAAPPARAEPAPRAPRPPAAAPLSVEGMIARQDALLQDISQQQMATLKALQGSLSSIETRLLTLAGQATERPRVAIFVDVPNVMYAADRMKVKLDYKKMLDFLVRGRELVRASAYAPISDDAQKRLDTQKFVQPFDDMGYRVVTKPHKRYADGSMKANFDVELAIDVLTMSDRLDIVTLVSGDGDFRRLVELVQSKGVRVEVVAFGQSTAAELRAVADQYIDLGDHLAELRL